MAPLLPEAQTPWLSLKAFYHLLLPLTSPASSPVFLCLNVPLILSHLQFLEHKSFMLPHLCSHCSLHLDFPSSSLPGKFLLIYQALAI